jgi:hypothetical protein
VDLVVTTTLTFAAVKDLLLHLHVLLITRACPASESDFLVRSSVRGPVIGRKRVGNLYVTFYWPIARRLGRLARAAVAVVLHAGSDPARAALVIRWVPRPMRIPGHEICGALAVFPV